MLPCSHGGKYWLWLCVYVIHIFKDNFYITNDKTDVFKKVFFCSTQLVRRSNLMVEPLWYTHTCIQMAEIQTLLMFSNSVKGFYEMFVKKNHREIILLLLTSLYDDTCNVCVFVSSYGQIVKKNIFCFQIKPPTRAECVVARTSITWHCVYSCVLPWNTHCCVTHCVSVACTERRSPTFSLTGDTVCECVCECVSTSTRGISFTPRLYLNTSWR